MSDFGLPTSTSLDGPLKELDVVAGVICHDGQILAAKRLEGGPSAFKWEFPGGKVEAGETPQQALVRELDEELGMSVVVNEEIGVFSTRMGQLNIHLRCYYCSTSSRHSRLKAHSEVQWRAPSSLSELDWALPDLPIVHVLSTT
jgi:8-oxo-dGTP diphosphatase